MQFSLRSQKTKPRFMEVSLGTPRTSIDVLIELYIHDRGAGAEASGNADAHPGAVIGAAGEEVARITENTAAEAIPGFCDSTDVIWLTPSKHGLRR